MNKRFSLLPFLNSFFLKKKRKEKKKKKKEKKKMTEKFAIISFKYWHFPFAAKFIAKELQINLLIEICLLT